jgi:hypothetical protein
MPHLDKLREKMVLHFLPVLSDEATQDQTVASAAESVAMKRQA